MELKKKNLEKFIGKIESRGYKFDKEQNHAEIEIDDSTFAKAVVVENLNDPQNLSVQCGRDGPFTGDENADLSKAVAECERIVGEILDEIENEES